MCRKLIFLVSFVLILGLAPNTFGAIEWDDGGADDLWNTAANWDGDALPTSGDDARIILTDPAGALIDATHTGVNKAVAEDVEVGYKGDDGDLDMTGGELETTKTMDVGDRATGTFDMSGGTITIAKSFGVGDRGTGTMTMSDGTITTIDGNFKLGDGKPGAEDATGTLIMTGGTINVGPDVAGEGNSSMTIGDDTAASSGSVTMSGNAYIDISGTFTLGDDSATGTLTMSGGTIDVGPGIGDPTKNMNIGRDTGTGTVTMSGGVINVSGELNVGKTTETDGIPNIGTEGTGTLTMTSGLIVVDANINIGLDGSTGTVSLSGDAVLEGGDLFIGAPGSGGTLDMCGDATLILAGNQLWDVLNYINDGLITVCGSVKAVDWDGWKYDYDCRNDDMTTVTVPEPATIALLGLGGLVLLRRKRR